MPCSNFADYLPAAFFFVNLRRRRSGWTMDFVGVAFFGEIRCLHKNKVIYANCCIVVINHYSVGIPHEHFPRWRCNHI